MALAWEEPPSSTWKIGATCWPTRRGNAELAGIGAGAGHDVRQAESAGRRQIERRQLLVQGRQIAVGDPAEQQVLVYRRADGIADIPAADGSQRPQLPRRDVAQRQKDGDHRVARLPLRPHVHPAPALEARRRARKIKRRRRLQRRFLEPFRFFQILRPLRIGQEFLPLLVEQAVELLHAQLGDQELHARLGAVLLFAQAGKHAGDGLRQRQHFLDRHKVAVELGLMRNGSQTAAQVHAEAALRSPVFFPHRRDRPDVVHQGQAAGVLRAAGKGHLEFPAEVLRIRVA